MVELVHGVDNVLHWHGSMVHVDVNKVQLCMQFMSICIYIYIYMHSIYNMLYTVYTVCCIYLLFVRIAIPLTCRRQYFGFTCKHSSDL